MYYFCLSRTKCPITSCSFFTCFLSGLYSDYITIANERIKAWEKVNIDEYFKNKKIKEI